MKKIIQKFLRVIGYELKKYNPFPDTIIPLDIFDLILFKLSSSKLSIRSIIFTNKRLFDKDIISLNLNKYNIGKKFFKKIDPKSLKILKKKNNIIILKNKEVSLSILEKHGVNLSDQLIIIIDTKLLSSKSIHNNNLHMLEKEFGILKFWQYIIYCKNLNLRKINEKSK